MNKITNMKGKLNITKEIRKSIPHFARRFFCGFDQPKKTYPIYGHADQINNNGITIRFMICLTGCLLKRRWDLNDYSEIAHTRLCAFS